jgi:addiction module HigA family antidote
MEMHNPPHPGEILLELYMEPAGLHIKDLADFLCVDRKTVSRLINKHTGVTVEMAIRLAKVFKTSERLWLGLQQSYEIWKLKHNHKLDLSKIKSFEAIVDNKDAYY